MATLGLWGGFMDKPLATKADDLRLISESHMVEERTDSLRLFSDGHMLCLCVPRN